MTRGNIFIIHNKMNVTIILVNYRVVVKCKDICFTVGGKVLTCLEGTILDKDQTADGPMLKYTTEEIEGKRALIFKDVITLYTESA